MLDVVWRVVGRFRFAAKISYPGPFAKQTIQGFAADPRIPDGESNSGDLDSLSRVLCEAEIWIAGRLAGGVRRFGFGASKRPSKIEVLIDFFWGKPQDVEKFGGCNRLFRKLPKFFQIDKLKIGESSMFLVHFWR